MDAFYKIVGYLGASIVMRQILIGIQAYFELHVTNFFTYFTGWTFFLIAVVSAVCWPLAFLVLKDRARWWITGFVSAIVAAGVAAPGTIANAPKGEPMLFWWISTLIHWFVIGSTAHLAAEGVAALGRKWDDRDLSEKKRTPSYW